MSENDSQGDEFEPMEEMPTSRLTDILRSLDKESTSIVNLDAILPPKEKGEEILQTFLFKIQSTVKVLSIRFNTLSTFSCDLVIDWISQNDHIETLYTMSSGFDNKNRQRLEDAWKKNLIGHRTENLGYTFIRVTHDKANVKEDT